MSLDLIDARKLRLKNLRYREIQLEVPKASSLLHKGEISFESTYGFSVSEDVLITSIQQKLMVERVDCEEEREKLLGSCSVTAIAAYILPEGHGIENGPIGNLSESSVETFVHALEPILMMKLQSLMSEGGFKNLPLPLHVYSSGSITPSSEVSDLGQEED